MFLVPRLRSGCDIKSLPLTPADAFLLSRVDAKANEHDLALVTGLTTGAVAAMLERLASLGAIELCPPVSPLPDPKPGGSHIRLRAVSAPTAAPPEEQGAGFVARSTPPTRPLSPEAEQRAWETLDIPVDPAALEARAAKLTETLDRGMSAFARQDHEDAISAYRLAASLAPDDPKVQAHCHEAIRVAAAALADQYWEKAVDAECNGRWEEAALHYARVCLGRPTDALAHARASNAALQSGNVRRAVEFARKAVEIAPGRAMLHVILARAYAAAGFEKSTHGEIERALRLAPNDEKVLQLAARVRDIVQRTAKAS